PGLASKRTVVKTHGLAFDAKSRSRAAHVGPSILEKNPVHQGFIEAVEMAPPAYAFNSLFDGGGNVTDLVSGDWKSSHLEACRRHAEKYTVEVEGKRDFVIVSCGGYPHDVNMVQAHKAIETASLVCKEGGSIVVLAECPDGAGSAEFEKWFSYGMAENLAERLAEKYSVGGQTAWSLKQKSEKFDIRIFSELSGDMTRSMGLVKFADLAAAAASLKNAAGGYILPFGAKFLPLPK
ncbi:MAG: hypothetical protein OEM82_08150, partial [Acidobacteriota bacterium]|nr:hypothetical protein [Acidobacteriota bacterium]